MFCPCWKLYSKVCYQVYTVQFVLNVHHTGKNLLQGRARSDGTWWNQHQEILVVMSVNWRAARFCWGKWWCGGAHANARGTWRCGRQSRGRGPRRCCIGQPGWARHARMAGGDYDGDLNMFSFDKDLLDVVKATEDRIRQLPVEDLDQQDGTLKGNQFGKLSWPLLDCSCEWHRFTVHSFLQIFRRYSLDIAIFLLGIWFQPCSSHVLLGMVFKKPLGIIVNSRWGVRLNEVAYGSGISAALEGRLRSWLRGRPRLEKMGKS